MGSKASFGGRLDISRVADGSDIDFDLKGTLEAALNLLKGGKQDLPNLLNILAEFQSSANGVTTKSSAVGGDPKYITDASIGGGFLIHNWLDSIEENLDIIDFTVSPIYEILDEFSDEASEREKREALKTAFHMHLAAKQPTVGCPVDTSRTFELPDYSFCRFRASPSHIGTSAPCGATAGKPNTWEGTDHKCVEECYNTKTRQGNHIPRISNPYTCDYGSEVPVTFEESLRGNWDDIGSLGPCGPSAGKPNTWLGFDGKCFETCYDTRTRLGTSIPRTDSSYTAVAGHTCNYGDEFPTGRLTFR